MRWRGGNDWPWAAVVVLVGMPVLGLGLVWFVEGLTAAASVATLLSVIPLTVGPVRWVRARRHPYARADGPGEQEAARPGESEMRGGLGGNPTGSRDQRTGPVATVPEAAAARTAVPRQLEYSDRFVGRKGELRTLDGLVADLARDGTVNTRRVALITGTAGVGKTTLATHWGHKVAERFPDGQLFINLRGFDPGGDPVDPYDALRRLLSAFIPSARIPAASAECADLYRELLADRRMLIILDNARDAAQVRPLLPDAQHCVMLVTSRDRLDGIVVKPGASKVVRLDVLDAGDAEALFAKFIGDDRLAAERDAATELAERCGLLPLALRIVAARAAGQAGLPLSDSLSDLRDEQRRLDLLDGTGDWETSIRTVFSWSYNALNASTAQAFRLLSVRLGPDFDVRAAASLLSTPEPDTRRTLGILWRMNLLKKSRDDRYEFLDLLRSYASERAVQESGDEKRTALGRVLDFYLHTAVSAAQRIDPFRGSLTLDTPRRGVVPVEITDLRQAMEWCAAEHYTVLSAISQAAAEGFEKHAWQLAWAMTDYFHRSGHWRDIVNTQNIALAAARRLGDTAAEANAHRLAGRAETRQRHFDEAIAHQQQALALWEAIGDLTGQAHAHLAFGFVAETRGEYERAVAYATRALEGYQKTGNRAGQARSLSGIAWNYALLGQLDAALKFSEKSLSLHRELGNQHGEADVLCTLAYRQYLLGDKARAIAGCTRALELWYKAGDVFNAADAQHFIGDIYHSMGRDEDARREWEAALKTLDSLGHADAREIERKLWLLDYPGQETPLATTHTGRPS